MRQRRPAAMPPPRLPGRLPRRRRAPAWLAGLVLCTTGCTAWTFDSDSPEVALVGEPPSLAAAPRLNRAPATNLSLLTGAGGVPYAAVTEVRDAASGPARQRVRLLRLVAPETEEVVEAPQLTVTARSLYLLDPGDDPQGPAQLTLRGPEAGDGGVRLTLPGGNKFLASSSGDQALLVWVLAAETKSFQLLRRDGKPPRELPVPPGVDPARPGDKGRYLFDGPGDLLYVQDAAGRVVAHATAQARDVDLGVLPRTVQVLPQAAGAGLIACDGEGLRVVPADGAPPRALDPGPCDAAALRYESGAYLYFTGRPGDPGVELRAAPLSGGGAPQTLVADEARQLLALAPGRPLPSICYSKDPAARFGAGIGDGWLAGRRFMERGRNVAFGQGAPSEGGGPRLRFLERAAASENVGELLSIPADVSGPPLHLALNARQFYEASPGRVVAVTNAAYRGPHNRLLLLDEGARRATWLADGVRDFQRIPGSDDLLVRRYLGQTYDILRLTVPPPP